MVKVLEKLPRIWESEKIIFDVGWKKEFREADANSFPGHGKRQPGTEQKEEIRRLKEELLTVTMERDILKKAVAIFSKPQK